MVALRIALLAVTALAAQVELEKRISVPSVDLTSNSTRVPKAIITSKNGANVTISGLALPGYDAYLGIPFAEPRKLPSRSTANISNRRASFHGPCT